MYIPRSGGTSAHCLAFTLAELVTIAQCPIAFERFTAFVVARTRSAPRIPVVAKRTFVTSGTVVTGPTDARSSYVVTKSVERPERITMTVLQ